MSNYNILTYLLGRYSAQSSLTFLRAVLFLSALGVYFLLMNIMHTTRNMQLLQSEKEMLTMQSAAAQRQLGQMKDCGSRLPPTVTICATISPCCRVISIPVIRLRQCPI